MIRLVIYILVTATLFGCLGSKKVSEKSVEKTTVETTAIKKDSTALTVVNKPIADKVSLPVPLAKSTDSSFDSAVNDKVDQILSKLNTTKSSGDNSYTLYYDLLSRQLNFEAAIGETVNQSTTSDSKLIKNKSTAEEVDSYVSKKVNQLPWYVWVIAAIILLNQILSFGQKLSNPLSMLTSFIANLRK
jgi:hypothetical protein